ncbi:uncharacterized protein LODBEIA_P36090 [Lodderomyces beijingensis]|uniref:Required for respiratory growth protein 9, mitochondrial n=1 Tax=Lodderomyces beijingensis TaxID=1775926 RepID=A0ABP0ZMJ9_9ASCO
MLSPWKSALTRLSTRTPKAPPAHALVLRTPLPLHHRNFTTSTRICNNPPPEPKNPTVISIPEISEEDLALLNEFKHTKIEPRNNPSTTSPPSNEPFWIKRERKLKSKHQQWSPHRKLSRTEMIKLKEMRENFPEYRTIDLADFFHISPEAVRRILHSKWVPNDRDEDRLMERWGRRKQEKQAQLEEARRAAGNAGGGGGEKNRKKVFTQKNHKKVDHRGLNKDYMSIGRRF